MKIRFIVLLLMIFPVFFACNVTKEGGYQFRKVYILDGDKFIDAQNYEIHFGLEGGKKTLEYIGPSSFGIAGLHSTSGIAVKVIDDARPLDIAFNDERDDYSWVRQSISIETGPTTVFRKVQCYVVSNVANGYAAPLIIIQTN